MAQAGGETREQQLERIEQARIAGRYEEARRGLEQLLAANPDNPDLLRRLASVSAAQGNLAQAQKQIDRALALAPNDLDIQLARANILLWRGERAAAQRQADAVAVRAPDYPELDSLQARIAEDSARDSVRVTALAIGAGVSDIDFDNRDGESWSSQTASVGLALSRNTGASLAVEREERAATDVRISTRVDHRLGRNSVYISGSVVPNADFRESWSIGTGGEIALSDKATALVDVRYAEYRDRNVFAAQPGLRYAFDDTTSVTARTINLVGGGEDFRLGGSLQFDYRPESTLGGFAVLASYPDVEADGVRQLRSGALGLIVPLADRFTLTTVGAYEDRENSYRRLSGTLVLGLRFGAP
ncbi:tetratricopeptide repeat protein [Alteriqipengyuania sp. 357]